MASDRADGSAEVQQHNFDDDRILMAHHAKDVILSSDAEIVVRTVALAHDEDDCAIEAAERDLIGTTTSSTQKQQKPVVNVLYVQFVKCGFTASMAWSHEWLSLPDITPNVTPESWWSPTNFTIKYAPVISVTRNSNGAQPAFLVDIPDGFEPSEATYGAVGLQSSTTTSLPYCVIQNNAEMSTVGFFEIEEKALLSPGHIVYSTR